MKKTTKIIATSFIFSALSAHLTASEQTTEHALDVVTTIKPVQEIIAGYLEHSYIPDPTTCVDSSAESIATYSPNFKYYVRLRDAFDGIRIVNRYTSELITTLPQTSWLQHLRNRDKRFSWHIAVYSPDGTSLSTAGTVQESVTTLDDQQVIIERWSPKREIFYTWNIASGSFIDNAAQAIGNNNINTYYADLQGVNSPQAIAYTPDSKYILASHNRSLTIFQVLKHMNNVIETLHTDKPITALALSHTGFIALAGGTVVNHDTVPVDTQQFRKLHFHEAVAFAFTADGSYLAVAYADNRVQIFNIQNADQFLAVRPNGTTEPAEESLDASVLYTPLETLTHSNLKIGALKHKLLFSKNYKYLACGVHIWQNQAHNLCLKSAQNNSCAVS